MAVVERESGLAVVEHRLQTPTGLLPEEVRSLRRSEKVLLAGWHDTKSGDDNGRPWIPGAVRRLSLEARLQLASDDDLDAAWIERERRRVLDVAYFTGAYGHLKSDDAEEPGPPIPFDLWPAQRGVLTTFQDELRIVVLKARQLGLTWLALHYAFHLLAVDPDGRNAVVLGLSQDGGYAKRLLERTREINDLLPPYLRFAEDRETRDSKTEMKLTGRGRMVSLPGTPSAPRSWQADLALCDEWAFVRNGQAGPTMRALLPAARQIIAVSSGDGPPEEEGNGQHFAQLYTRAAAGENEWVAVFLPASTHPARTAAWRAAERENYDTDEEFLAEQPETPDEALVGAGKDRFFPLHDVNAAVKLGGELDALLGTDDMPPPVGDAIRVGKDWGEETASYVIWPLEGGGIYVPPCELPEEHRRKSEPAAVAVAFHHIVSELQSVNARTGAVEPPIEAERYDSAGAQSNRTYMAIARDRFSHQYQYGEARSVKVRFNDSKKETAGYLRRLFRRVGQGRTTQVIAISPANAELVRQFRGLLSAPDGLWQKKDDHGPDAIVAGTSDIAKRHRELGKGD
jgi:hypothetical protein